MIVAVEWNLIRKLNLIKSRNFITPISRIRYFTGLDLGYKKPMACTLIKLSDKNNLL